ncbi:MAG: hypothetical protein ACTHK0_04710 [Ginsengibacter sp.]
MDLAKNIVLIGGTSHTGKSTVAKFLAAKTAFNNLSTDSLARHPGRPWKERLREIPLHVQEHYCNLPVDELVRDVVKHYEKIWPIVQQVIETNTNGLILEGSALLPKLIQQLNLKTITPVWLTATDAFLKDRVYKSGNYSNKSIKEKYLIDKFAERTIAFNRMILKETEEFNFPCLEVERFGKLQDLVNKCIQITRKSQSH